MDNRLGVAEYKTFIKTASTTRVGQNHTYTVYIRYFWREPTNNTVYYYISCALLYTFMYGVYTQFWPTPRINHKTHQKSALSFQLSLFPTRIIPCEQKPPWNHIFESSSSFSHPLSKHFYLSLHSNASFFTLMELLQLTASQRPQSPIPPSRTAFFQNLNLLPICILFYTRPFCTLYTLHILFNPLLTRFIILHPSLLTKSQRTPLPSHVLHEFCVKCFILLHQQAPPPNPPL